MDDRTRENARRLVYGLYQSADNRTIQNLARLINYNPEQLDTDIKALVKVFDDMESGT